MAPTPGHPDVAVERWICYGLGLLPTDLCVGLSPPPTPPVEGATVRGCGTLGTYGLADSVFLCGQVLVVFPSGYGQSSLCHDSLR